MGCSDITQGIAEVCKISQGGNEKIYLMNFVPDAFTTLAGVATAINPLLTVAYDFYIDGNGHTFTQVPASSRDAGTTVYTQTLVFMLKRLDPVKNETLDALTKGKSIAVIKDRNGVYHAMGLDDGIDFTYEAVTGSAKEEMNGYTITGVSTTLKPASTLDALTVTAFLALVA